jgi:hypothetical protein
VSHQYPAPLRLLSASLAQSNQAVPVPSIGTNSLSGLGPCQKVLTQQVADKWTDNSHKFWEGSVDPANGSGSLPGRRGLSQTAHGQKSRVCRGEGEVARVKRTRWVRPGGIDGIVHTGSHRKFGSLGMGC